MKIYDLFDGAKGFTEKVNQNKPLHIRDTINKYFLELIECILIENSIFDLNSTEDYRIGFIRCLLGFGFYRWEKISKYKFIKDFKEILEYFI